MVKQIVGGPDAEERYAREVLSLRLAARIEKPVVPALLGVDPGERVLVLEHLDHRRPSSDWLVERARRGTIDHLARIPDRDWKWGTATARQRLVHRLGVVGRMTADRACPSGLSRLSTDMRQRMLTRWPELPPVPAQHP